MREYIVELMEIADRLKIYHLQTTSYAEHKALGKAYDAFVDLVDAFAEVYMGKYGRFSLGKGDSISLDNYTPDRVRSAVDASIEYVASLSEQLDPQVDGDLQNIAADMLGTLNRLRYLLTLK